MQQPNLNLEGDLGTYVACEVLRGQAGFGQSLS